MLGDSVTKSVCFVELYCNVSNLRAGSVLLIMCGCPKWAYLSMHGCQMPRRNHEC